MFNKGLLIIGLIGNIILTYIPTTHAYGICSCLCCDGQGCDPIPQGTIGVSSCDGLNCITACKNKFPLSCSGVGTYEIDSSCRELMTSTTTSTSISTTYSTTIYGYGICSCSCCNGDGCIPTYQGYIQISSCVGQNCNEACQNRFPWTCGSEGSHEVDAKCRELEPTTITSPPTTTVTMPSTISSVYGICSCSCCASEGCTPTNQGSFQIPSCDGEYCIRSCQKTFPWTCGSSGTHEVDAKCSQIIPSTTTSTISTTVSTTPTMTTSTYAICSCFCCNGDGCVPVDQGDFVIPSCDGQTCIMSCQKTFQWTCGSSGTHEVDAKCRQISPSTTTGTITTMVSTSSTTASFSTTSTVTCTTASTISSSTTSTMSSTTMLSTTTSTISSTTASSSTTPTTPSTISSSTTSTIPSTTASTSTTSTVSCTTASTISSSTTSTISSTTASSTTTSTISSSITSTMPYTTVSTTTYAYGICSCFCCNGAGCDPIPEGDVEVPSCNGLYCITACKNRFPFSCNSVDTHEVQGNCKEWSRQQVN